MGREARTYRQPPIKLGSATLTNTTLKYTNAQLDDANARLNDITACIRDENRELVVTMITVVLGLRANITSAT